MPDVIRFCLFCLSMIGFGVAMPAFSAEVPHVHTSRASAQILPLPKEEDVFHFVVFGDRTGGPAEGIKVLARAVQDANLLDPDLVMTVGDLVNGYNQTDAWMKQMEEFRSTMSKLRMPWFPVAGNHDIYWRKAAKEPEAKPPREHEQSYERHFGPLWYWFEHKNTGFLILFSDEGHPDGRQRDFGDREQQQISRTQLSWIAAELQKMKHLRHIFVFLHHPFWWGERYPGSNWDEVHKLLARNGNVRAVIAGHIHQMRYDGVRDGIGYYALATTGGSLTPGMEYEYFGLLHQFNVVTVRSNGFSMASIPVGGVFDPRQFTPARHAEVEAARYLMHELISPPIELGFDGSASAVCKVAITNPCALPIDVTLLAKTRDPTWMIAPDHRHSKLEPEEGRVFEFLCARESTNSLSGFEPPEFELRFDVLTPEARLAMPVRSLRAKTRLSPPRGGWPVVKTNQCLVLNGTNACLEIGKEQLNLPAGPFTVEAWVKPSNDTNGAIVSNIKIGGFSLEVAGTPQFRVQTDGPHVNERRASNLKPAVVVRAQERLTPGRWTHLAGIYDGGQIALFIDGQKVAATNVTGARLSSDKSLYVGARPNGAWNVHNFSYPLIFWRGAVDDVRISRSARYTRNFTPPVKLVPDDATVLSMSNDQQFGPFVPVESGARVQAAVLGQPRFAPAER